MSTILVVVDRLSKYAHFVKEVVRLHGFPSSIVSNRDRIFMSIFWWELFHLQNTTQKKHRVSYPQTDGQSEIVNRALETYLRCFVGEHPRTWAQWYAMGGILL